MEVGDAASSEHPADKMERQASDMMNAPCCSLIAILPAPENRRMTLSSRRFRGNNAFVQKLLRHFFPYAADSEGMTVRVAPSFLAEQSRVRAGRWFWAYHIRIENHRETPVQLLARHWEITDGHGETTVVEGDGVVGEQPIIPPGGSHDYVSGCPLTTSSGEMEGYFVMTGDDGRFLIEIPLFDLRSGEPAP
jgi:ApaG protein